MRKKWGLKKKVEKMKGISLFFVSKFYRGFGTQKNVKNTADKKLLDWMNSNTSKKVLEAWVRFILEN